MSGTLSAPIEEPTSDPGAEPPAGGSLRKLAIRGAIWTTAGFGCGQILRLASNLILTRLLAPELFGLMTLAQTAMTGLVMFSDIGTSASVVRNPRGEDPRFLNTAWTLQAIRGVWLWLGMVLLAVPLANFYGDSRLKLLLPLLGISGFINGFTSTAPYVLNRRLEMKQLALFELGTQLLFLLTLLACVLVWPTIWGMVLGGLLGTAERVICSHLLLPNLRNRLAWDRSALRELISFGKWLFLSTAALFLGEQADRMVLGKLFSFEMLGIYGVAATLADMPRQVSATLSGKVVFPAIARVSQRSRAEIRKVVLRNRRLPLMAAAAGLALMTGLGDLAIRLLYDARYHQAAWMLPILALSIWPRVICNASESALLAIGRPQYMTVGNVLRFVATVVGIQLGYMWGQIPGAIVAVALRDLPYYVATNFGLYRERLSVARQDALLTGLLVVILGAIVALRLALGFGTPLDTMWSPAGA
jgi:O-antigen/teichoic acid export membrane protein